MPTPPPAHDSHAYCYEDSSTSETKHCLKCDQHDDTSSDPCPCTEHHHQAFNHAAPLVMENQKFVRLPAFAVTLADLNWTADFIPESPVYELDMPPLI
ncbi:hypothetical protein JIN85_08175 [Luteolibacter pohnpeiensis]|uniref:Uncharacterized protein n=1 Tax=Luteolibacter pohnpeiensis TaxID=454153 RepID=A0A934SA05_9BACT|nr:hypothetical protein [Luteolibacter pohnpeiensis]MBK1882387.1 hypothetical protein [Luteolibacter pohnpeiensis]